MKERGPDLAMLVLGLVIAAAVRASTFAALLGSLALALVVVNVARVLGWPRAEPPSRTIIAVGLVVVLAVPLYDLASRAHTMAEAEGLSGLAEHVADRARIEADPSIAPPIVPGDRPLSYFVRASGERVRVRLTPTMAWIDADALGHGVFRVDYDPRANGAPDASAHETVGSIEVDGSATERTLLAATPAAHPRWLRLSPDRTHACVTSEETDEVIVIDGASEPTRIPTLDGPTDCAVSDDGAVLVDPFDFQRVALRGHPSKVVSSSTAIFVTTTAPATLTRFAVDTLAMTATRALVSPAVDMAVAPDGSSIVLALTDFVEDGAAHLGNHYVEDRLATFDATTLALIEDRPTARRTPRQDHAGDVDRGASPMGLSFTLRGTLLVAFAGTDEVWELDGHAPARILDTAAHGLSAPFSAVELANGSLVVSSPSSGRIGIFSRDGSLEHSIALAPSDRELLRSDPDALQIRFGERAFYEATRAGISCQSCHLHGGTDGAFHNIGGRLSAPTLDVRGVLGTSPYLRDGTYPMLRDLHEVAVTEYRGYREPGGDRARTLEAWMRTLPPPATHVARDVEREREGLDVFFRAGCPDCHTPPAFTSLTMHPIEAVFPDTESVFPDAPTRAEGRVLDTPSLRSCAASAPYLYDGRATSLEAIFDDHNASNRHGHTRALSEADLRSLFVFLRSL